VSREWRSVTEEVETDKAVIEDVKRALDESYHIPRLHSETNVAKWSHFATFWQFDVAESHLLKHEATIRADIKAHLLHNNQNQSVRLSNEYSFYCSTAKLR
jgi:hypothetical protein